MTDQLSRHRAHAVVANAQHPLSKAKPSSAPDYLVYQVVRGQPKHRWPLIGRASLTSEGNVLITFNQKPSQAVWLLPLWPSLFAGEKTWNRRPDYVAVSATSKGKVTDPAPVGDAWDQSGGTIFLKFIHLPGSAVLLRRRKPKIAEPTRRSSGASQSKRAARD